MNGKSPNKHVNDPKPSAFDHRPVMGLWASGLRVSAGATRIGVLVRAD